MTSCIGTIRSLEQSSNAANVWRVYTTYNSFRTKTRFHELCRFNRNAATCLLFLRMKIFFPAVIFCGLQLFAGCKSKEDNHGAETTEAVKTTPAIAFTVVNDFPHDTANFLEGLEFFNGQLLESTGERSESKLLLYDLATGKVAKNVKLDDRFFGEGVTVFRDTIYQLTYQESTVLMYNAKTFQKIGELPFSGEGWGLTHDSSSLIATNGSNNLYYYEPGTFKLLKKVEVNEGGNPAVNLNELEYVNGYIYANQWQYSYVLKIDPATGEVVSKMDLTSVINQEKLKNPKAEHLNGLAFNPATKKFYITGKDWAKIYELNFTF